MSSEPGDTSRQCPICGSGDETHLFCESNIDAGMLTSFAFASRKFPEFMHHRMVLCPDCDLAYASPAPHAETLAREYENAAFDSAEEALFASRTYAAYTRRLIAHLPDKNGVIDIGCGDGVYLGEVIAMGFDGVAGIEPSLAPIQQARPHIKPLIRTGLFNPQAFEAASASLITCFQTIEHVKDPLRLCEDARTLLKDGGALFLIGHNRRALSVKLLKRRSAIYDLEHLQLFSTSSFRKLLTSAGYSRVKVFPVFNRYPLHYLVKLSPIETSRKIELIKLIKKLGIGQTPITMGLGNLGAVGYK